MFSSHKASIDNTLSNTTTLVNHPLDQNKMTHVNLFEFLACYLRTGNFYDAIDALENRYHSINFKVAFAFTTFFYVVQNKEDVKKVLRANAVAGFQNHNFDVSHGHFLNINAVPAWVGGKINPIWQGLHAGIAHSVGDAKLIGDLVTKHFHHFLAKHTFSLDIAFENFMENFWCDFMFGSKANAEIFSQTRRKLLAALRYSYYDSRIKNVPFLGTQACKLYGYIKKNEFAEIDASLRHFLQQAESSLFTRFREHLLKNENFSPDLVETALLDNAFVLILALDFIQNAMYETLRLIVKSGLKSTEERKKAYHEGLHNAFLFPFRSRVPKEPLALHDTTIPENIPIYINLLKTGFYHSSGPRICAGIGVTQWIKDAIWDQLKDIEFDLLATTYPEERKKISHSRDVPISPERYEIAWRYSRDYLQKILPHYPFKGVDEFFDVLKIHENPVLSHYVTTSFIDAIEKLNIDRSTLCIAAPEVRGIPAAAAVAEALHVPLVIIRKQGKTPGEVLTKKYANAYAEEAIEISTSSCVRGKQVVLIDDGIASGKTTITCCDLIEEVGGKVISILAMINHTYRTKTTELQKYPVLTLFDFAGKSIKPMSLSTTKNSAFFKPQTTPKLQPVEPAYQYIGSKNGN